MLRQLTSTDHTSLLGRLIRFPLKLVPASTVIKIPSGINKGFRWICGSSIQRCWFGTYEFDKQDFVTRAVKPGMTVWDIGANVGFYTLAFSRLVGASGAVFSFEPLAANVAYLLRHIELNALSNVTVIQTALSDSTDLLGFTETRSSTQGALAGRDKPYLIPTITPASLLEALPDSVPNLIKLDIEGSEGIVLAASKSLLEKHTPDILLAIHGKKQEEICVRFLVDIGYTLFYLDGTRADVTQPLSSDEIFAVKRSTIDPAA